MTRYYAAQRTFWVDPVSGTIVKETERANHYFARDPLKPEVTFADYQVTSTEETVESQVNAARDERDRLALWSRVLPITFTAAGLVALVGGGLFASFSLRTEGALMAASGDRDDHDYRRGGFEEPVPGAEAETEKLPTQRPDFPREPSGSDPPRLGSAQPPHRRTRGIPTPARPSGANQATCAGSDRGTRWSWCCCWPRRYCGPDTYCCAMQCPHHGRMCRPTP